MSVDAPMLPQVVSQGVRPGTMYGVGGRVREGNPPNFGPTLDMVPETPATGAADLIASRIPPGHINWLLDC